MTSNSKNPHADFKPEVLGRVDAVLTYASLDKKVMKELVSKQLKQFNERLKSKQLKVRLADHFIELLCDRGYDPTYGARPLQGVFNKMVIRPLSQKILAGELMEGDATLDWIDGELKVAFKVQANAKV